MLYVFILGGFALSLVFDLQGVQNTQWYLFLTATLLAIGLYSSTFGISLKEARHNLRLILTAVTVGVALKALLIGSVLSILLQSPFGFILGIIMAQIDPLSTAALMQSNRLSKRAKTIISSWSAFDDPVTVLLSLYVPVLLSTLFGSQWQPLAGTFHQSGLAGYFLTTGLNILFAAIVFVLWKFIKHYANAARYVVIVLAAMTMYVVVFGSLSIAIYYFWMLGVALLGLFMRPPILSIINRSVHWALYMAAILLGMLIVNGINLSAGVVLGVATFSSQILVGFLLTRKLVFSDRIRIAFAQQNGITAIILGLLFEPYYPGVIGIVAPAIITVNVLYAASNQLLNAHLEKDWARFTWQVQREKIRLHMKKV